MRQAYSIMMQVMVALAVAEERLFYEHRDLHSGNVLISECADQFREWGSSLNCSLLFNINPHPPLPPPPPAHSIPSFNEFNTLAFISIPHIAAVNENARNCGRLKGGTNDTWMTLKCENISQCIVRGVMFSSLKYACSVSLITFPLKWLLTHVNAEVSLC